MSNLPKEGCAPKYDFVSLVEEADEESPFQRSKSFANGRADILQTPVDQRMTPRMPQVSITSSSRSGGSSNWTTPSSSRILSTPGTSRGPAIGGSIISTGTSSRSLSSGTATPRSRPSVIVAVVEGRGNARGEVGVASIDLKRPELVLSQYPDSPTHVKTITKLQILQPLEILMPHTASEPGNASPLFKQLCDHFRGPSCSIVTVQRHYFNEARGLQCIKHLAIPECKTLEIQLTSKYYCLATAAALVKYIEFIQHCVYAPNSLKVIFTGSENTTMIDYRTCKNLELIMNVKDPKSEHTLYGVLRQTKTQGGARLLRANILQPPCDLRTILSRLDAVTELLDTQDSYFALQNVVKRFLDVDHLLTLCVTVPRQETIKTAENSIINAIYLKNTLELVAPLRDALQNCSSDLLVAYKEMLSDPRYQLILESIEKYIQPSANYQKGTFNMRLQMCYAIKPNTNGLLDIARRTYGETVDDITEIINQLGQKHKLNLQSGYCQARGFYVKCVFRAQSQASGIDDHLPAEFIRRSRSKNTISFTTEDLIKMNGRASQSLNEIYIMSNVIVSKLMSEIMEHFGCLHKLSEIAASLDLLLAFTKTISQSPDHVRPIFSDTLCIKKGKHPILDRISMESPVANDMYVAPDTNFVVITGPNMSGKSTFLKQVALMQIMAQIGCYVPAQYATFKLVDHIFSCMGSGDDIESNSSTFVLEMKELNYILSSASDKSLVIIDELGRGTSVDEGIGICYAICEHLLQSKAFTLFTTHFMELSYLDTFYPNVANYHMEVEHVVGENNATLRIHYTHTIATGPTKEIDYGIKLAELTTLPEAIVENAKKIAEHCRILFKGNNPSMAKEVNKRRTIIQFSKILHQISKHPDVPDDQLATIVKSLNKQYFDAIEQLDQVTEE